MQFLKTLFWVVLAVGVVLFATANWTTVTINLWGGLEADVKLPVLALVAFLIGFLPMLVWHRARIWSLKRRQAGAVTVANTPPEPAPAPDRPEERLATDSKAWPAA